MKRDQLIIEVVTKISLWTAIKLRIAGAEKITQIIKESLERAEKEHNE